MVYLSRQTSLPRMWISVIQTGPHEAEAKRIIYRNMEANIDIPDRFLDIPDDVRFIEGNHSLTEQVVNEASRTPVEAKGSHDDSRHADPIDATNADALHQRALLFINTDQLDKALADCEQLIDRNANDAEAHSLRCLALGLKGDWDEALLSCDTAIQINPELAMAYLRRGAIWAGKGDDAMAEADYDAAIRLGEDSARAMRSRILFRQGKFQEAIEDFSRTIEIEPDSVEAYAYRGVAWQRMGEQEKALSDFNAAIRIDPSFEMAYANRGSYWLKAKEYAKALSDFEAASRLNPDRASVLNQIAAIRASGPDGLRDGKEAVQFAARACQLTGWENHEYLQTLAGAYAESGDFSSAIHWQAKAVQKTPPEEREQVRSRLEQYRRGQADRM